MRALAIAAVLLVVVAVIAALVDRQVTEQAEAQASERVSTELGTPADVDLQGWPVSLRLLLGSVPRIVVTASDVPIPDQPARLDELDVQLSDAELRLDSLRETGIPVRARTGTFRTTLSAEDVLALAGNPPLVDRVELADGTIRFVLAEDVGVLDVVPSLRPDELVLQAQGTTVDVPPVRLSLADLPAGARVEAFEIADGELVLRGTVQDVLLEVPG